MKHKKIGPNQRKLIQTLDTIKELYLNGLNKSDLQVK
jgi:hypothetical protein